MANRLARYHRVAALAHEPTPIRRLGAAGVAGGLAFVLTQLLLGLWWGAGTAAVTFSCFGAAMAAAVAAVTMKRAMAVIYGIIAAIWLLLEALALTIGCIVAALG
jgi:hypothetical protein